MPHLFPSAEWTVAYQKAVNENPAYREAGRDWTFGPVAMFVDADPAIGVTEATGMILDVHQGTCRSTQYVTGLESASATPFLIEAPYSTWKDVIEGRLDPILAMMQGTLRLTRGDLPTMIRFVEASRQLVASATKVETKFAA